MKLKTTSLGLNQTKNAAYFNAFVAFKNQGFNYSQINNQ